MTNFVLLGTFQLNEEKGRFFHFMRREDKILQLRFSLRFRYFFSFLAPEIKTVVFIVATAPPHQGMHPQYTHLLKDLLRLRAVKYPCCAKEF
jgi:hypothetical protein